MFFKEIFNIPDYSVQAKITEISVTRISNFLITRFFVKMRAMSDRAPSDFCNFLPASVRPAEAAMIEQTLSGPNHLILASPAHFGKTALIRTAAAALARPLIEIDGRRTVGLTDVSALILKAAFRLNRPEDFRQALLKFQQIPSITTDLMTGRVNISFTPATCPDGLLDESLQLLASMSTPENRLIVFWRDFPSVLAIAPNLCRRLRALLESQENINHVFTGSPARVMADLFERAASPFFHFGQWVELAPLPENEIQATLAALFRPLSSDEAAHTLAASLVHEAGRHPYHLRQASEALCRLLSDERPADETTARQAVDQVAQQHAWDYERLWDTLSQSQKKVLQLVAAGLPFAGLPDFPATTLYSAAQKLLKTGLLIKTPAFEVEDPFLRRWIASRELA